MKQMQHLMIKIRFVHMQDMPHLQQCMPMHMNKMGAQMQGWAGGDAAQSVGQTVGAPFMHMTGGISSQMHPAHTMNPITSAMMVCPEAGFIQNTGFMQNTNDHSEMAMHWSELPQPAQLTVPGQNGGEVRTHTAKAAKKRKGNGMAIKDEEDGGKFGGCMRLPEVVATLAAESQVLEWNEAEGAYVVIDGPGFERRFNELRYTRGKKVESATHRPFSRMHTFFVLVRGEKWAGTGSAFRFKQEEAEPVAPKMGEVSACNVNIQLSSEPGDAQPFTMTLQHFLDVTGAGDLFRQAMHKTPSDYSSGTDASGTDPSVASPVEAGSIQHGVEPLQQPQSNGNGNSRFLACELEGLPMLERFCSDNGNMEAQDVSNILGTMWSCDSRGDQAYFFMRKEGQAEFANGAIVRIRDGVVVSDCDFDDANPGLLMVISDKNAKWKGEPHPLPQHEPLGHWCCFLGQVPVTVEGVVQCGDFIGPKGDGSGVGIKVQLGCGPVIGVALVNKDYAKAAVIKTMSFAGLNAINQGSDFKEVFNGMREMAAEVDSLRSQVRAVEQCVDNVTVQVGNTDGHVQDLRSRLEQSLGWLNSRINKMEANISTPVAMAVPTDVAGGVETPSLPGGDGEWRYGRASPYRQSTSAAPQSAYACGPSLARSWIAANRKLTAVLVCTTILVCGVAVGGRRWRKGGEKPGGPMGPKKKPMGMYDPCKVLSSNPPPKDVIVHPQSSTSRMAHHVSSRL